MLESGLHPPGGLLVRVGGRNVLRRRGDSQFVRRHVAADDSLVHWYHELVPGGLSNFWTGAVPRFAAEDFFEGARLHDRFRWPLSYEELKPYYRRVERILGVSGGGEAFRALPASHVVHKRILPSAWARIARAAGEFGRGLTPLPLADGSPWLIRRHATAFNSFARIVRRLEGDRNFRLVLGAHALQLEWDGDRQAVRSVLYYDRVKQAHQRVPGAAVVVAGGPLSSTKLLLDSTSNSFPDGLGNSNGLLGSHLHDHVHDMCIVETERPLPRLGVAAYLTRAAYDRSTPLSAAQAAIASSTSRTEKILNVTPVPTRKFGAIIFGTMLPSAENYVRPHPLAKDEFGFPLLDIQIRYRPEELENAAALKREFVEILDSIGRRARISWSLPQVVPGTSHHFGGTVRMHDDPRYGALDGWNRLRDATNVLVVDASCFTTGVEKNPALTSMAIAARAAERLAHDLKAGTVARTGVSA
jgi:choline dehydrogenase-like flavoprotein